MTLSEKIISLRKHSGWSQEELANQLGVTRQSVSKWEAGTSIPDIKKVIQMSEIFGVTTDYLLRDDMSDEQIAITPHVEKSKEKTISMEEANSFMEVSKELSVKTATAVTLCIWSPIILIMLDGFSENGLFNITKMKATAIGLPSLLIMVAVAVFIFLITNGKRKSYEYIEKEPFSLQYGVEAQVLRKKENMNESKRLVYGIGAALIIISCIPTIITGSIGNDLYTNLSVCLMLFLIGIAVNLFVRIGVVSDSFKQLLQEDEYSEKSKIEDKKLNWFPGVYWSIMTALYLSYSFITNNWGRSWIIWPIASVAFSAFYSIFKHLANKEQ